MDRQTLSIGSRFVCAVVAAYLAASGVAHAQTSDDLLQRPVRVVSTTGAVDNANALTTHAGQAVLTMRPGGPIASVTLDYGRVVGGLPLFNIASLSGSPTMRVVYSEAQQYLGATGDASYPDGNEVNVSFLGNPGAASLSRVNAYRPAAPGVIVNRLVQGGERFEVIQLTTPGSIALSDVGIRHLDQSPQSRVGYFESSDAALNEIWKLGARTLDLDTVPARSLPPTWSVTPQGLVVQDSAFSVYQAGTKWSGYTASFDMQVVRNEAGWMVGANPTGGFRLVLAADDDVLGTPNTLRLTHPFVAGVLAQVPLPFDLKPNTWHRIRTITGSTLQVYVDDKLLFSAPIPTSGSFGFAGYDGGIGCFRNLQIDAGSGASMSATLTDPAVLDRFAAGTNAVASIVDGAKRDRYVWSGDLAVAAPTLYYSSWQTDAVKGALELYASYQRSDGQFPGDLPPQLALGIAPGDSMPDVYYYSLSYSIYFLTTLYDYYLYTGDLKFVQSHWSAVRCSLRYLQGLANPNHLIVTDASNDADWHPHDASKLTGTVTEFNVLYYRALRDSARLAAAIGDAGASLDYSRQAAQVKAAINASLFNPGAGLYDISDQMRGPVAQDANSMAVLFGVAPAGQHASILSRMDAALATSNGPLAFSPDSSANPVLSQLVSPFVSSFDVWAHFEAGDAKGALSILRTVWGRMRAGNPYYSGATWEAMAPDGTPVPPANAGGTYASLAHGWASGPTSALSKYVLGVRPVTAGYRTWLMEPQPGDLSWAKGRIPTPYGAIDAQWHVQATGIDLTVTVPTGTHATIGVPVPEGRHAVSVNGRILPTDTPASGLEGMDRRSGYVYLRDLPAGRYRILTDASRSR